MGLLGLQRWDEYPKPDPMGWCPGPGRLVPGTVAVFCELFFHHLFEVSQKWGYPKTDGLQGKIPLTWMIWGYPHFWRPPFASLSSGQALASGFGLRAFGNADITSPSPRFL